MTMSRWLAVMRRVKIRIGSDSGIISHSGHKLRYPVLLDELRESIIMVSNDTK